jgi:molybdopterin-guanine dinucleotide biosynthesis protein A
MRRAGFVLVGGQSARMGQDKALLPWNSHALVEEVAARVRDVAGNVALVGAPERYAKLGFECLPDLREGMGPLAGIEAALASGRAEVNLITACDLPGIESEWLWALMRAATESGALCTVLRDSEGFLHPLCGVYRGGCLPIVRRLLDRNRLKVLEAIRELGASTVDIDAPLANVNTREEWAAWQMSVSTGTSNAG